MAEIPCTDCGAQLAYDPGSAMLKCPYCGTENALPEADEPAEGPAASPWGRSAPVEVEEQHFDSAVAALRRAEAGDGAAIETTRTIRCTTCGAEVGFDDPAAGGQARRETTLADDCPFCAAPLALDAAHDHRHPAPTGLLPFAIDQGRAREGLRGWLASRWFAPNDLKKFAEASRPIQGVYVPHYTYDTACRAEYRGRRGVEYRVRRGKKTEVRVRWYPASGRVHHDFDDVLVPATATVTEFSSEADVHGAAEWDLQALTPYATHYLAGFRAEAPSLGLEKGFGLARGACDGYMRQLVRRDIGGDRQQITWMSTTYDRVTFKHVLLPVWLAAYRYSNTPYRVAINGRTGRVTGQRPYSWTKIAAAVLAALLVVAAIAWLNANGYLGEVQ